MYKFLATIEGFATFIVAVVLIVLLVALFFFWPDIKRQLKIGTKNEKPQDN